MNRITTSDTPLDFSRSAYTFPLAGIIIAVPAALCLYLTLSIGLDAMVAAIVTIMVQLLVTGALHEDGLADVADGFWGGTTLERKLEIMRDSAIGTYGTLALVCSITLRVALLAVLIRLLEPIAVALLYIGVASLSRLAILQPWGALPAARSDDTDVADQDGKPQSGLSARYGVPSKGEFIWACISALPALAVILFGTGVVPFLLGLLLLETAVLVVSRLALKHIGGHTGDVLGATQQMSEIGLLLGLTIAI